MSILKYIKIKLSDDIVKHGSLMFFASSLVSVFNLIYHLYMVRNLSPINYGILNSLIALLTIISIPVSTVQTVVTKFVSTFHADGNLNKIRFLLFNMGKKVSILGLCFFLIIALGSSSISNFLQIPSNGPVIIIGLIVLFSAVLTVTFGGLQGLESFGYLAVNMVMAGGLKLVLSIFFVIAGFGVMGAVCGFAFAPFFSIVLSFGQLRKYWTFTAVQNHDSAYCIDFPEIYRYFYPVAISLLCFMVLTQMDIILVKHFFSPLKAGYYSVAQMVGKIILFLPGPIATVMFPKVSNLHAQKKDTFGILKKSLVIVGLLCGAGAVICILVPSLIMKLLSGKVYPECIPLVRTFSVGMTFFALLCTVIFYLLSIRSLKFVRYLASLTVLQFILVCLFHQTLLQVILILCANAFLSFVVSLRLAKKVILT